MPQLLFAIKTFNIQICVYEKLTSIKVKFKL